MTPSELDLAALDLTRRLAAGADLEQALDQGEATARTPERTQEARAYAQAQERLADAADAAVQGN